MAAPAGTQMEYESEAYTMYHRMRPEWSCMSFDIIPDALGHDRTKVHTPRPCSNKAIVATASVTLTPPAFPLSWYFFGCAQFPHTAFIAAGTTADQAVNNRLQIMKIEGLTKTEHDDGEKDHIKKQGASWCCITDNYY